jgi:hypothetical protein
VSIPLVKGGVKAPPAKRQCRAGPKAGARRGFTYRILFNTKGNYVAAGVGLRNTTSGNITISGIPASATIQAAYLYWSFLDNGATTSEATIMFAGRNFTGTQIGSGPDTCWFRQFSRAFRANVTSAVTGNGTYAITGVASGGSLFAQGASLVIIYSSKSVHKGFVHLTIRGRLYCSLGRAASVLMLCGLI